MSQRQFAFRGIFGAIVLLFGATLRLAAAPPEPSDDDPLYAWCRSTEALHSAGRMIGEQKYRAAEQELARLSRELPLPYREWAGKARAKLHSATAVPGVGADSKETLDAIGPDEILGGYYRYLELGNLCQDLHCPRAAADFYWRGPGLSGGPLRRGSRAREAAAVCGR